MRNIMRKEMELCALPLTFIFILFGLMFFLPGYPVLCGTFFVTLGLYQGFQAAREANDIVFSVLLPVRKTDVVKGKYLFVCFVEGCSLALMLACALVRMTVLKDAAVYRSNAMMNANLFALGGAFVIFGLFNAVFLGGFFKTAYNLGRPFIVHTAMTFLTIGGFEAAHYIPALKDVNAFGFEHMGLQCGLLCTGLAAYILMTLLSYRKACRNFERTDL